MKVNEKEISYVSNFQTDLKKSPYPTNIILETYNGKM